MNSIRIPNSSDRKITFRWLYLPVYIINSIFTSHFFVFDGVINNGAHIFLTRDHFIVAGDAFAKVNFHNDIVMSAVHGLRIKELLEEKAAGRKIIGSYCVFVPDEIVLAANATLVGLCAGADFALDEAEKLLPRNTYALIKSTFGFKLGKVCPYPESADLVVGENTCDGKKKAYETLAGLDALPANQVSFYDNPARFIESVNKICDELEIRVKQKIGVSRESTRGRGGSRIALTHVEIRHQGQ